MNIDMATEALSKLTWPNSVERGHVQPSEAESIKLEVMVPVGLNRLQDPSHAQYFGRL